MIVYQKCKKNSFEEKYLKKLNINDNPNINCFIGFDFGFFRGMNVYYSNNIDKKLKERLSECIKNSKVNLRLFTNYDCEFDIVVLLGYSNLKCEKRYLKKNISNIVKFFSFL